MESQVWPSLRLVLASLRLVSGNKVERDGAGHTLSFDLHTCAQGHTTSHIPKINHCQIITYMWGCLFFFEFVCFSVLLQTALLLCCSSEVGSIVNQYCQGHVFFQNLQQGLVAVDPCLQLYCFNICLCQHLGVSICFITVYFKDKALAGLYVADGESLFHLFSIGVKPRPGSSPGLFETT